MAQQPNSPKPPPISLDDIPFIQMLHSLARSTNELEKTWSESLDEEKVKKAHTEVLTLWESFTRNFPVWTAEQSSKLKGLGLDTIIKRYPLDDEGFNALTEPKALIDRYNQFSIASLYQTQNLLRALNGLKEPTKKEVSIPSGDTKSWWEAGAFSLIRASVHSLAFTLEQQTAIYEELIKESHKHNARPLSMQYMDTLRVLLNNDLYEAIPPILVGAIRYALAERADIAVEKLPPDLAAKMEKIKSYETLGHLYAKLVQICPRIGFEEAPDRGYLVPLVIGSVMQLERLVSQPLEPKLIEELKA